MNDGGVKMGNKRNQHVIRTEEGWSVKAANSDKDSKRFSDRHEAITFARALAKKQEVCIVVHDETGRFKEFDCSPKVMNQHVIPVGNKWAVISADGKEISKTFSDIGEAISYGHGIAKNNNVCMVLEDEKGMFTRVTCPPDKRLDLVDVFGPTLRT